MTTLFARIAARIRFWRWYLTEFVPIAGADDGVDDQDDKDTADDDSDGADSDDAGDDKDDSDDKPDPNSLSKQERDDYHRLRREAAERAKKDREQERKRAEEEGRHADVVKAIEDERDSEKERADKAEGELASLHKELKVNKIAGKLKFRDPADALLHLPKDIADDDAAIERALKTVAKEKQYLIDGQGGRSGAPAGGGEPPESGDLDTQIKKAEEKGDTKTSMRLKSQKLLGSQ